MGLQRRFTATAQQGKQQYAVYLHTRSDGKLYSLSRVKAKTKVRKALIRNNYSASWTASLAPVRASA